VKELNCPITAKVRVFNSVEETIALCQMIESCGVQLLTVHGRTVNQNKLFTGQADWEIIKKIKKSLRIPVVANGGISSRRDAVRCLEFTGADGVMSSEALLENPRMFSLEGDDEFENNYIAFQLATAEELVGLFQSFGSDYQSTQLRGHLFKILYRITNAPLNQDLRDRLMEVDLCDISDVLFEIHERFRPIDYDMQVAIEKGLLSPSTWYMRYRYGEAAQNRILSQPKFITRQSTPSSSSSVGTEDKLAALKQRLIERKTAAAETGIAM